MSFSLKIYIRGREHGTKSPALTRMLHNMGKIPELLGRIGTAITRDIKANLNNRLLRRRTGNLYRSWAWAVHAAGVGWRLIIGSDVIYAAIHNFGGFTGAGYTSRMKKTRYVDKAIIKNKKLVRRLLRDHMANLSQFTRG